MYKFIEKWEKIGREVRVNKDSVEILEGGMVIFKFYQQGYYTMLVVVGNGYKIVGISQVILDLLNETMKELEIRK